MNLHLNDKVIIVTGGAKGINEQIIKTLAGEGVIVCIIGMNEAHNKSVAEELKYAGGKAESFVADTTNADACKSVIEEVITRYQRINGLINSTESSSAINLKQCSNNEFIKNLHDNIVPYFMMTQHALPALIQSKGSIVNISFSKDDNNGCNISAGAHKALTREWAVELLKYEIRVNAVVVSTEAFLQPGSITEQQTANTVAFLLSKRSSHTTGQIINA